MKQQIKETNIALAATWEGVASIGEDIVLADQIANIPVPRDARRMNFILIMLCTRGTLKYTLDTQQITVTPGDMLLISERHVVNNYEASPDIDGQAILMSVDFFHEIISNVSDLSAIFLYARTFPVMKLSEADAAIFSRYFEAIKNRVSNDGNHFRRALVRTLLLAMFYDLSSVIYQFQQETAKPQKRSEAMFTRFIKLVEEHCRTERRVSWYAGQLGITPKYLSETIKAVSRRTPNEWIDNYVILELRVMLKNTTKNIKQITEEMNFPNQSFLGKYFKEHVGMSPSEFRRS
jgi:AraC-like DNA-binding protein